MGAILGLSKVEGFLKGYSKKVEVGAVEAARITQTLVVNSAKQIVPVKTGALQLSIQEGPIELRNSTVTAFVFALQNYASNVEFGQGQRKQPYLRPSFEKHEKDFTRLLTRVMDK